MVEREIIIAGNNYTREKKSTKGLLRDIQLIAEEKKRASWQETEGEKEKIFFK